MRRLLIALCLVATICAYHIKQHEFNVVIDKLEYSSEVPLKYKLGPASLKPTEEVLKTLLQEHK